MILPAKVGQFNDLNIELYNHIINHVIL